MTEKELLKKKNEIMFKALLKISNKNSYSMIDGMMRGWAREAIKEVIKLRRHKT